MKSIREIATEIAAQFAKPTERFQLAEAIEQALRDERERCAKIAEAAFTPAHTYASENAERYHAFDDGQKHAMVKIAAVIRKDGS